LPDKAIDLIDEAASKLRLEINSLPEELESVERRIRQLEIEKEAIKREKDKPKLRQISEELANLNDQRTTLKSKWQAEKDLVEKIQQTKKHIEDFKLEADRAERDGDFGKVAELRYGKTQEATASLEALKVQLHELQGDDPMINEEVSAEEIADVVSKWTGVPVSRMLQSEREKLLHLEDELHHRVVGQNDAITAIADAIRRSRAGLQDENRPIGSFIFLGTTGVGKTELAKALAEFLFNSDQALVRIDMSEYQERHSVSRLIGAPPGYVGYDESGQLTEAVRRKPYSVVLLDEIEKAHPDVFNILLQVLDDGRLTDNKGRVVDFKNTIIIMTSNIGSHIIQERFAGLNDENKEEVIDETRKEVMSLLKSSIRPEFLNRIDEIIMFTPLSKEEIHDIVGLMIRAIQKMLAKNNLHIAITDEAVTRLAEIGYDPQFGARPLKRVIQKEILNELSKMILAGEVSSEKEILIDFKNDQFSFVNQ
jgi:ATP-dependent Clp protease ATP-binding subunit ClpB